MHPLPVENISPFGKGRGSVTKHDVTLELSLDKQPDMKYRRLIFTAYTSGGRHID